MLGVLLPARVRWVPVSAVLALGCGASGDANRASSESGSGSASGSSSSSDASTDEPETGESDTSSSTGDATSTGESSDGGSLDSGSLDSESLDSGSSETNAASDCPEHGQITYTLVRAPAPTPEQEAAYALIESAMDEAVARYNCHTNIEKALSVTFNPDVPTADGNVNGSIRFGGMAYMNPITAMHEISHTVGVGSYEFGQRIVNGIFTGPLATAELRAITGNPADELHGDSQHFWPYGLNQVSEVMSDDDLVHHCRIVVAIREDIGA